MENQKLKTELNNIQDLEQYLDYYTKTDNLVILILKMTLTWNQQQKIKLF